MYHTKCAGYHQHYGLNNLMLNNVVADVNQGNCDGAVRSSQHPGKCELPAKGEAQGRCSSFSFVRNIVCVMVTGCRCRWLGLSTKVSKFPAVGRLAT